MDDLTGTLDEPTVRVLNRAAAGTLNCNLRGLGMEHWRAGQRAKMRGGAIVTVFEVPVSVARQVTEMANWDFLPGDIPPENPEPETIEVIGEASPGPVEPSASPGVVEAEPAGGGAVTEPKPEPAPEKEAKPEPPSRPKAKRSARGRPKPKPKKE